MKDIRIFIASSKELKTERNYLAFLVLAEFAARGFVKFKEGVNR